jgi:hypothetical protein
MMSLGTDPQATAETTGGGAVAEIEPREASQGST